jgi:hypothetical protein
MSRVRAMEQTRGSALVIEPGYLLVGFLDLLNG